ncbi:MAG: DNA translocase FtsK 4TM domain-containing protein [bacterium]
MGRHRRRRDNPLDYITIPRLDIDPEIKRGIWALFLLVLGIVSVLALFDSAGVLGRYLASAMIWTFGWGKWLFPITILILTWLIFNHERYAMRGTNYFGLALFVMAFQGSLHVFINQAKWAEVVEMGAGGGHLGWLVVWGLIALMGFWASVLLLIVMILIALMLTFNTTLANLWVKSSWPARFLRHPLQFLSGKNEEGESEEHEPDYEENETETGEEEKTAESETEEDTTEAPVFMPQPIAAAVATNAKAIDWLWEPTGVKIDLPLSLLDGKSGKARSGDIKANSAIIKKTLEEFGIDVEMGEVSVGPTVTQYTFKPADGVKLSRITALNNDLAMALAAHPVRIEAPIPGKSLVGIEVPNKTVALVNLRSVLNSEIFKTRKSNTMISLGKDVAGKVWLADLHKMPHLLVAGATGSGKSVMLNTLIVSLLYSNNPDDLRFIMVDPKRVELTIYNDIPHLITPVITEISKTVNALKWCLNEMDRRFQILAQVKKRDIDSYNATAKQKMPYIVFVIDELADLMVVAAKDIEMGIVRLAQMARAVGIHLVLATQRPSVNVITGVIKANMPTRIAFSVASGIDSRTILDGLGAEKLLGKGDMLFSDATLPKPKRIQGAFVSDGEIKRIVRYLKSRAGGTFYLEGITERQKVTGIGGVGIDGGRDDDDQLTNEAKEIVINAGKASATLLQRRLSIGYARAAKILDILEERGIIGPPTGAKPREVMITKEQYASFDSQAVSGMPLHSQADSRPPDEYLISENGHYDEVAEPETKDEPEENELEDEVDFVDDNEEPDPSIKEGAAADEEEIEEGTDEDEAIEELPDDEDYDKDAKDGNDFDKYFSR